MSVPRGMGGPAIFVLLGSGSHWQIISLGAASALWSPPLAFSRAVSMKNPARACAASRLRTFLGFCVSPVLPDCATLLVTCTPGLSASGPQVLTGPETDSCLRELPSSGPQCIRSCFYPKPQKLLASKGSVAGFKSKDEGSKDPSSRLHRILRGSVVCSKMLYRLFHRPQCNKTRNHQPEQPSKTKTLPPKDKNVKIHCSNNLSG